MQINKNENKNKKAIILLSGGMDSVTCLAIAQSRGYEVFAISFDYGQRHRAEINAAKKIASTLGITHKVIQIDIGQFGGSALTDHSLDVPTELSQDIPITYVPARNTVFLSFALAWAEVLGANDLFIGVNAVDYSGYPDCRPEFISAYETMANLATKAAVNGEKITIHTPLIDLTKAEIIRKGVDLSVNYSETVTCYQADNEGFACGKCDACRLRKKGFADASISDNTLYQ